MIERPGSKTPAPVTVYQAGRAVRRADVVATEEPLEIRLEAGRQKRTLAVTMRTPGADFELTAGFLYGEGVVSDRREIREIAYCVDRELDEEQRYNVVLAKLRTNELPELATLERHFLTSSACGVCGKANLEQLHIRGCSWPVTTRTVSPDVITTLSDSLRSGQGVFQATGGLHAAGLFDLDGKLLAVREDVGRHNAVDKLVGWALMNGKLPLTDHLIMVSGRTSFEILQKCLAAGAPIVCSVSAPSSLAVSVAKEFGMTLVGFLRGDRFNVYSAPERIAASQPSEELAAGAATSR